VNIGPYYWIQNIFSNIVINNLVYTDNVVFSKIFIAWVFIQEYFSNYSGVNFFCTCVRARKAVWKNFLVW
jgi:hypothetical protein